MFSHNYISTNALFLQRCPICHNEGEILSTIALNLSESFIFFCATTKDSAWFVHQVASEPVGEVNLNPELDSYWVSGQSMPPHHNSSTGSFCPPASQTNR